VLAGGGGEPLSVLTAERAVAALPFGGKYRIIDFVLSNCCHSGIRHLGVLTQHAPTSLHDHIGAGRPWGLDHRAASVRILQPYLTRERSGWFRGTGDALVQSWDEVHGGRHDHVLVVAGDHVYRMDYRELLRFHEERGATLTLPVLRVPAHEAPRFGMIATDVGGRVRQMEEKPASSQSPFASMGIYLFDTAVLERMLAARPVDLVREVVIPLVDAGERVFAYEFEDYWEDVGTVSAYYGASMELVSPEPRLQLNDPVWPIFTRDEERPPATFGPASDVVDSLVAGGAQVNGRVVNSVLFPGVLVERGATVQDAVVFNDAIVRAGAQVSRAVLDKYVQVGEGAQIGAPSGGPPFADPAGLTLLGKEVRVPPGARLGRGCVVGIGVGPGELVAGLPDGSFVSGRAGAATLE
jgi:glucose-1-phosphate adenylyltransferase